MNVAPSPVISRRPALPLVWVVPLVALAVGGWMIYREYRDRGPEITIEFVDGSGVEPGKTKLVYRGVTIGSVTRVELGDDLRRVIVAVRLRRSATSVARAGTLFWVARPEIGFSGVRGLETLFTGAQLNVLPGTGAAETRFLGMGRPPPAENTEAGRAFVLKSDRLHSMAPGAPLYYREIKVGVVESSRLADDAASVLIRIRVHTPFVPLVRTNSRFWVAGGPSFKMGLFGAELKSTSLEALFSGGAAFATPDGDLAPEANDGAVFPLHREPEKEWEQWQPRIRIFAPESTPEARPHLPAVMGPSTP